jgi:hypothetical protein
MRPQPTRAWSTSPVSDPKPSSMPRCPRMLDPVAILSTPISLCKLGRDILLPLQSRNSIIYFPFTIEFVSVQTFEFIFACLCLTLHIIVCDQTSYVIIQLNARVLQHFSAVQL